MRTIRFIVSLCCVWGIVGTLLFYLSQKVGDDLSTQDVQLTIEMATKTESGEIKIFWNRGAGFCEQDSASLPLQEASFQSRYVFSLPNSNITGLRVDPTESDERVSIHSLSIKFGNALFYEKLSFDSAIANDNIKSFILQNGSWELVPMPGRIDPFVVLPISLDEYRPKVLAIENLLFAIGLILLFALSLICWVFKKRIQKAVEVYSLKRYPRTTFSILCVVLAGIFVFQIHSILKPEPKANLDVDFHTLTEGAVQFFWATKKPSFRPSDSRLVRLNNDYHSFSVEAGIPYSTKWLRVDFPFRAKNLTMENLSFSRAWWSKDIFVSESSIVGMNDLEMIQKRGKHSFEFRVTGTDPYLVWNISE